MTARQWAEVLTQILLHPRGPLEIRDKVMDARETVSRLILGSNVLDTMQANIRAVVDMVIRYGCPYVDQLHGKVFESPAYRWRLEDLKLAKPNISISSLRVCCDLPNLNNTAFFEVYALNAGTSIEYVQHFRHLSVQHVQPVYMILPELIKGVVRTVPQIEKDWKPFIDASLVPYTLPRI
jgi:hypothetical protein